MSRIYRRVTGVLQARYKDVTACSRRQDGVERQATIGWRQLMAGCMRALVHKRWLAWVLVGRWAIVGHR